MSRVDPVELLNGALTEQPPSSGCGAGELRWLALNVGERTRLRLIGGNHDRHLAEVLAAAELALEVDDALEVGPHLLLHGDGTDEAVARGNLAACRERGGRVIMGHEHPAITLHGGVASRAKCVCFLAGADLLVVPAFSQWAAGSPVGRGEFLSHYPRLCVPEKAVAILAGKLLPVKLGGGGM